MSQNIPIVLVHGLFGSLGDERILELFKARAAHAPDLLGYGTLSASNIDGLTLEDQADRIADYFVQAGLARAHLVGHSIGGAIAVLFAARHPEFTASLTSVEGNLTLKDAFWSEQLAAKSLSEVEKIIDGYKRNPQAWIADAGVPINTWTARLAEQWLANQPARTIHAQAAAVVSATRERRYLDTFNSLLQSPLSVNLIAGSHSSSEWDVPAWVNDGCSLRINMPDTGHLMMAEDPALFAATVEAGIEYAERLESSRFRRLFR